MAQRAFAMDLLQIGELEERRATDRFIHTYHGSRSVRRETGLLMHTAEQISISSGIPAQSRQICSLLRQENKEQ